MSGERWHGTAGGYTNQRCRCDECTSAWRAICARGQRSRTERLRNDPLLAVHGLYTTYSNWGCRCDECREANAAYSRDKYARRKASQ